jgi:hypothetical protein
LCFLVPLIYPAFSLNQKTRFLLGGAIYIAAASAAIAWWVGSTPWEMLGGPANESIKFYRLSNNPLVIWAADWLGFSLGSKLLAVVVAGVCAALLFAIRLRNDLLSGFSICVICGMYWSYSRHYDLVLYSMPLLCLLRIAVVDRSRQAAIAFFLLGCLLWSPIRIEMSRWPSVELAFGLACLFALATIVARQIAAEPVRTIGSMPTSEAPIGAAARA